jgi:hypothetical protein
MMRATTTRTFPLYQNEELSAVIAQTEAQKSSDLFMKCRYLDEFTGGRWYGICNRNSGLQFYGGALHNSEIFAVQYAREKQSANTLMLGFYLWRNRYGGERMTPKEQATEQRQGSQGSTTCLS